MENGPSHLQQPKWWYYSHTLIMQRNSQNTKNSLSVSLQHLLMSPNTPVSPCSTEPSVSEWPIPTTYHSITMTGSVTSSLTTSSLGSILPHPDSQALQPKDCDPIPMTPMSKSATDGTSAIVPLIPASIITSASPAAKGTKRKIAMSLSQVREQSELGALCWKQPKWSCGFLWVHD